MSTNVEECLLNIYLAISAQEAWKQFTFPFWFEWIASSSINLFFFSEGLHEIHPTRSIVACQNIFCFAAEQESPLKIMQPHSVFSFFYCKQIHLVTSYHVFYFFFYDFTSHYQRLIVGHSKGPERVTWKLASNSLCH